MERIKETVLNVHYIEICKCCASCAHKVIIREKHLRWCTQHGMKVPPSHVCHDWQMSRQMLRAGSSRGAVRDKETKEVLF